MVLVSDRSDKQGVTLPHRGAEVSANLNARNPCEIAGQRIGCSAVPLRRARPCSPII